MTLQEILSKLQTEKQAILNDTTNSPLYLQSVEEAYTLGIDVIKTIATKMSQRYKHLIPHDAFVYVPLCQDRTPCVVVKFALPKGGDKIYDNQGCHVCTKEKSFADHVIREALLPHSLNKIPRVTVVLQSTPYQPHANEINISTEIY